MKVPPSSVYWTISFLPIDCGENVFRLHHYSASSDHISQIIANFLCPWFIYFLLKQLLKDTDKIHSHRHILYLPLLYPSHLQLFLLPLARLPQRTPPTSTISGTAVEDRNIFPGISGGVTGVGVCCLPREREMKTLLFLFPTTSWHHLFKHFVLQLVKMYP